MTTIHIETRFLHDLRKYVVLCNTKVIIRGNKYEIFIEPLEGPDDRYYYQNDRLLPPAPCLPLPGPSHRRPVPLMRIHTDYNHDPYDYDLYDNCQNPTGFMPQMYGPRPPFCPVPERPIQFVDGLQGLPGFLFYFYH